MTFKLALPKGRLLAPTAKVLERAGLGFSEYSPQSRLYRLASATFPQLQAKMLHEKDIPIQVAVGNYDLGICGLDWVQELVVKYSRSSVLKVRDLGYGKSTLYLATSQGGGISSLQELGQKGKTVRIASEYPNLAESLALRLRLGSFKVFPLWGAAEAYPPEDAEVALLSFSSMDSLLGWGLRPLDVALSSNAFLVANKDSWENKDMSLVLTALATGCNGCGEAEAIPTGGGWLAGSPSSLREDGAVRLALPDGHQQAPAIELFRRIGLGVAGYAGAQASRRPAVGLPGVTAKVIRPQDMPSQVANGNFDLALGGKDWLLDHLFRFPSSPVRLLQEMGTGKVKVVAVVGQEVARDVDDLRRLVQGGRLSPLRVASEYVNIADRYARNNHLSPYKVIPTWGASEAYLPEDADLLIENTETGKTLARHNLEIIDTLFESSACLMGNASSLDNPAKRGRINSIVDLFRQGRPG